MLRSFRLANHRSLATEQELSLLPIYDRERAALPVAAIYGANASGKSNLLDALVFMRDAVLNSFRRWDVSGGVPRRPFRLDPVVRAQPSGYVVDLMLDEVRYTYGFTVDDDKVPEEWLYSYPEKKKRVLFERQDGRIRFGRTAGGERAELDRLHELTRPNALFLGVAAQSESGLVMPVDLWFRNGITERLAMPPGPVETVRAVKRFVGESQERRKALVNLVEIADAGVFDIDRFDDEAFEMLSAGTRSWVILSIDALHTLAAGGAMVVDQIDTSLHPLLTARLIGLFREAETNPHGAQLIFTTHDASLLGTALGTEVLARDEVWFVEKDRDRASRLYPLSDFKPKDGENRERRYLGGSYGALSPV